uniref:Uncharacterized protein n=1 Tax=Timspurckia oligopyrenoides TaxID=708627 RepID=A0A7S1ESU7_9RHOD|mmetsp:Transcript_4761/g.8313  ORF Transcript_4761/g.8313 Transcript_4761/m.8313 type:complete len:560 (+) Transcript_4761:60-1739(+)
MSSALRTDRVDEIREDIRQQSSTGRYYEHHRHHHQISHGTNIPQNDPVDVVLYARVLSAPESWSGSEIYAVLSTRFLAHSRTHNNSNPNSPPDSRTIATNPQDIHNRNRTQSSPSTSELANDAWIILDKKLAPNFSEHSQNIFAFILPVGFYESREMRIELYTYSYLDKIASACCGFAEMRLAESEVVKKCECFVLQEEFREEPLQIGFEIKEINKVESGLSLRVYLKLEIESKRRWNLINSEKPLLFWVLFRKENDSEGSWSALYRSEVRSARVSFRSSGISRFLEMNLDRATLSNYIPWTVLRIEFFQYLKPPTSPLLLGYIECTETELLYRSQLNLHTNAHPFGSLLTGNLQIHGESRSPDSFECHLNVAFTLNSSSSPTATASTAIATSSTAGKGFILDFSATVHHENWPFSNSKLLFVISRVESDGSFNVQYRSEVAKPDKDSEFVKFKLTRLQAKMFRESTEIRIEWFHHRTTGNRSIGSIQMMLEDLKEYFLQQNNALYLNQNTISGTNSSSISSISSGVQLSGQLHIQQVEESATGSFIAIHTEFHAIQPK